MNEIAKKVIVNKLDIAQKVEQLSNMDLERKTGIPNSYFSTIRSGGFTPKWMWELLRNWTNSGVKLAEFAWVEAARNQDPPKELHPKGLAKVGENAEPGKPEEIAPKEVREKMTGAEVKHVKEAITEAAEKLSKATTVDLLDLDEPRPASQVADHPTESEKIISNIQELSERINHLAIATKGDLEEADKMLEKLRARNKEYEIRISGNESSIKAISDQKAGRNEYRAMEEKIAILAAKTAPPPINAILELNERIDKLEGEITNIKYPKTTSQSEQMPQPKRRIRNRWKFRIGIELDKTPRI